jgi:hypothetical protein
MALWMQVTMDEYELPLVVARSSGELARLVGVSNSTVAALVSNAKRRGCRCRYVKVEVDDDEETD